MLQVGLLRNLWFNSQEIFPSPTTSKIDPGPTQCPIQWIPPALCLEVSWPGRWLFISMSCWGYESVELTSTPPYALIAYTGTP